MSRLRSLAKRTFESSVSVYNRNPWSNRSLHFVARNPAYPIYDHDWLTTPHIHSFLTDERFQRSYDRAVDAAGWDYQIHWRVHVSLWAASLATRVDGAFVECGTGRGFMASAICEAQGWTDRPFFLVDTFDPRALAEGKADPDADSLPSPNYAEDVDRVRDNFLEWPGVQIVQGRVPKVLDRLPESLVAFLHLDMNHPTAEVAALQHFWPRMTPGAVALFDDYAFHGYRSQHDALNAAAADLGFDILALPTGQGLAIK